MHAFQSLSQYTYMYMCTCVQSIHTCLHMYTVHIQYTYMCTCVYTVYIHVYVAHVHHVYIVGTAPYIGFEGHAKGIGLEAQEAL